MNDLPVALSSDNPLVAMVPDRVVVKAQTHEATFAVTTSPVHRVTEVTIQVNLGGAFWNATLEVQPATLASFSVSPARVLGGSPVTGTVSLTGPAPAGGRGIELSTDSPDLVSLPRQIVVPEGAITATFTIPVGIVKDAAQISVRAADGEVQTVHLWVLPVGLSLTPSAVRAGRSAVGTVALAKPAPPGGALVILASSDPAIAQVPGQVIVPAGESLATFDIRTTPASAATAVQIFSVYEGQTWQSKLTMLPPPSLPLPADQAGQQGK
jgi:hypothetical protein